MASLQRKDKRGGHHRTIVQDADHAALISRLFGGMKNGQCSLRELYYHVAQRNPLSAQYKPNGLRGKIRRVLQQHDATSKSYKPGNPDLFRRVRRGVWGLKRR